MSSEHVERAVTTLPHRLRTLEPKAITHHLQQLPQWSLNDSGATLAIERSFHFDHYLQTIAFVNAVAWLAEQHNHHPSLHVQYRCCTVQWTTHDAAGLTLLDFDCAQRTDALVNL